MKFIKFPIVLFILSTSSCALAEELKLIQSCNLGAGQNIKLLKKEHGLDGIELFLGYKDKNEAAFSDMPETTFVGEVSFRKCINEQLIFTLSYGPPYQKGIAIRYNKKSGKLEKIFFSQKAVPQLSFSAPDQWLLVVPNVTNGAKSSKEKKYLFYNYTIIEGQQKLVTQDNQLPKDKRYKVTKFYSGQPRW